MKIDGESCKKCFSLNKRHVRRCVIYVIPGGRDRDEKQTGRQKPGKKREGERERKKVKRKIAENFTLIAQAVIVLLLSKYISSQTENCIHYQVYFVQRFFNAATKVCVTFAGDFGSFQQSYYVLPPPMITREIDSLSRRAESQFCRN